MIEFVVCCNRSFLFGLGFLFFFCILFQTNLAVYKCGIAIIKHQQSKILSVVLKQTLQNVLLSETARGAAEQPLGGYMMSVSWHCVKNLKHDLGVQLTGSE